MVLATRPRQDDIKHHLPDSADVSIVRGDRLLRLRTISATREDAERTFLLFTFTYGLGAGRAVRVGESPGGTVWEAPVTAVGRDARVCMSCDRYVPIFDCAVDANNICMACMLAGRGPAHPPVPYAAPRRRGVSVAPITFGPATPSTLPTPPTPSVAAPESTGLRSAPRRRRGGRRRYDSGRAVPPATASA